MDNGRNFVILIAAKKNKRLEKTANHGFGKTKSINPAEAHKEMNLPGQTLEKLGDKIMSASISILGNTGRDVELRYTPQGTPVASFSIASNTVRKTSAGQEKQTDWFNVSAFGKQAETLAKYLNKGSSILVRGKLTFNPWLSREGEARVSADVILQDFDFAGGSPKSRGEVSEDTDSGDENAQEMSSQAAQDDADEEAEMKAALHEPAVGAEPFVGQF